VKKVGIICRTFSFNLEQTNDIFKEIVVNSSSNTSSVLL